jgi:hypothetical protein
MSQAVIWDWKTAKAWLAARAGHAIRGERATGWIGSER